MEIAETRGRPANLRQIWEQGEHFHGACPVRILRAGRTTAPERPLLRPRAVPRVRKRRSAPRVLAVDAMVVTPGRLPGGAAVQVGQQGRGRGATLVATAASHRADPRRRAEDGETTSEPERSVGRAVDDTGHPAAEAIEGEGGARGRAGVVDGGQP